MALRRKSRLSAADRVKDRGHLAAVLAERRLELDLSQEELADLAGITRQTVVSLEAGRPASLEVVATVLDVLGLRFEVVRGSTPGGVGIAPDLARRYGIGPEVEG